MSAYRLVLGLPLALSTLALSSLSLGGCTRNLCDQDPMDPHCVATVPPMAQTLTVTPPRVSLASGGSLAIAVSPAAPDGTPVVLRRTGAMDLLLGMLRGGMLSVMVNPADLNAHGVTPGAGTLVVSQSGQPDLTAPLRVYIEPQYSQPAMEYDTKPDGDYPTWLGIGKTGIVYGLNLYPPFAGATNLKQRLVDYQYVAGPTPAMDRLDKHMPVTFGGYKVDPFGSTAPARALLAGDQILVASFDSTSAQFPVIVDLCQFATGQCNTVDPMTFEFKSVQTVATDQLGSLLAVQSASGTFVYRPTSTNPFAQKLAVDPLPSPAQVVSLALGDLDGDGLADLLVLGANPLSATVLLQSSDGTQLRTSAARSAQLLGLLNGQAPAAATLADLDIDGLADLIFVRNSQVAVYYGQVDGTLVPGPQLSALSSVDSVAAGAIAETARPGKAARLDLAFGSSAGQRIAVLLNQAAF